MTVKVLKTVPFGSYASFKKRIENMGGKIFSRRKVSSNKWMVSFTSLGHLKIRSVKRKSVKRKSVKRKSVKRKSVKRKSVKRKSVKRKSVKRKSVKRHTT